jgi:N-glycosylase/DNA lyase
MQPVHVFVGNRLRTVELPDPDVEVLPNVRWGDAALLLTPAWIAKHAHIRVLDGSYDGLFRAGANTLAEDTVFCLLGGHGIRAEVAEAAYVRLRDAGLFAGPMGRDAVEAMLKAPLNVQERPVRYRFPVNRARYIVGALEYLRDSSLPADEIDLRDHLVRIPGIGLKTASYVVRNHLGSDRVAILDVHILRACRAACLFPGTLDLPRDYRRLESLFLAYARAAGVRASFLDLAIWETMRVMPKGPGAAAARLNQRQLLADGGPLIYVSNYLGMQAPV